MGAQSWDMVGKEEVMSKLKPEGFLGDRQMVRRRAKKKGNSRPKEQHVQRLRGWTKHFQVTHCG